MVAPKTSEEIQATLTHERNGDTFIILYNTRDKRYFRVYKNLQKIIYYALDGHSKLDEHDLADVVKTNPGLKNNTKITRHVIRAIFEYIHAQPRDPLTSEGRYWTGIINAYQDPDFPEYFSSVVGEERIASAEHEYQEAAERQQLRQLEQISLNQPRRKRKERYKAQRRDESIEAEIDRRIAESATRHLDPSTGSMITRGSNESTVDNVTTHMGNISLTSATDPMPGYQQQYIYQIAPPGGYLQPDIPNPYGGGSPTPPSRSQQPQYDSPTEDTQIVRQHPGAGSDSRSHTPSRPQSSGRQETRAFYGPGEYPPGHRGLLQEGDDLASSGPRESRSRRREPGHQDRRSGQPSSRGHFRHPSSSAARRGVPYQEGGLFYDADGRQIAEWEYAASIKHHVEKRAREQRAREEAEAKAKAEAENLRIAREEEVLRAEEDISRRARRGTEQRCSGRGTTAHKDQKGSSSKRRPAPDDQQRDSRKRGR